MASIEEAIRRLRYIFTSEGAQKLADDAAKVTATTTTTEKASLSLEKTFANLERRYVTSVRSTQDYDKVLSQLRSVVQQHPELLNRANVVLAAAAERYGQAGVGARMLTAATSGLSGQLIALSAGAGPVGVFLSALGPWGLGAAAGLGLAEKAISSMIGSANRMAEFVRTLRDSAQTMGLNTDQLQALDIAAASVGVSADKNAMAFERFTVQLNELRRGSGTLYTELLRVNAPLVEQLARTRDVTTAIDLMAKAYASATDQVQKNAIARAAFGRQGFNEGRVLTAIDAAGGIEAYKAGLSATDRITQDQINHWALLGIEIEHSASLARNNVASIFTGPVLELELEYVNKFLEFSRAAKDFSISKALADVVASSMNNAAGWVIRLVVGQDAAKQAGPLFTKPTPVPEIDPFGSFAVGGAYTADKNLDPQFVANSYKTLVGALGSAASATQHLVDKQLTLYAQYKSGAIDLATYEKAVSGAITDYSTQAINARVGALGMMATTTDIATQAQLKINKANLEGAHISGPQAALIVQADVLRLEATKQNAAAQFGLVSATDILNQKNAEYLNLAKQLGLSNEQIAAGYLVVARNARVAYEASQVAASAHPQLAQLAFDSANLDKQFDQFATGSLNNMTTALADFATRSKTAGDAARNFGLQVVRALDEMLIKMIIVQPIAEALRTSLGGGGVLSFIGSIFGGGTAGSMQAAANEASAGIGVYPAHGGGIIGSLPGTARYIHPAYYENAPRMHGGGDINWAAGERPLIGLVGERMLNRQETAAYNRGDGGGFHFNPVYHIDARGSQMTELQFKTILAQNNKEMMKQIKSSTPEIQRAFNQLQG